MTFDAGLHIFEAIIIVFWVGVSYGDLRWIKGELQYLRKRVDKIIGHSSVSED